MRRSSHSLISLSAFFVVCFAALALVVTYWAVLERETLLARPDNPRALISYNRTQRGRIVDRQGLVLAETVGPPGQYERRYELSAALVVGYASFRYGLGGLEEALNSTLSGDETDPFGEWWTHEILGEPKTGKEVKLTLDLNLQRAAFNALVQNKKAGAVVIIAPNGEVLALVSAPSFNPATLEKDFPTFSTSSKGELINRATTALYPSGALLELFPSTITLTEPPALPIPTRAQDRNKTTPLQMALLTVALLNEGPMPSPILLSNHPTPPPANHPVALLPRDTAAQLREKIKEGYALTVPSGFGQGTLGWFIGFANGNAVCVVLEEGTGEEARTIASAK